MNSAQINNKNRLLTFENLTKSDTESKPGLVWLPDDPLRTSWSYALFLDQFGKDKAR